MKKIDIACIIDDDPIFVFGTKRLMQLANFCNGVLVFKNGKEAYDSLKTIIISGEKLPDLIFLDLNMPIWDGWQFLDEFIQIPIENAVTIFIVTSSIDPEDIKRAKSYEIVSNYLVKPIKMDDLKKLMEE
ncbi:response regulator [Arcicella lustrica]|uniref:Response regulator n=1 Tax=Arcicella lustrica TaxID=2984196 RepID=A0ABU5SH22_9BACT|nr:response regulator [Arcicella sp. DC25W]MEA5426309.1 response regulator [Arcicella sp. DC25W]